MKLKQTEAQLQKIIIEYINITKKGMFWRNNNVGVFDRQTGAYRMTNQKKGVPDIIGVYRGYFIGIEVKSIKGKMSEHQLDFKRQFERNGGVYYMANDFDKFKNWFDNTTKCL
jgi:penicillin-binding protein-related factor A (putative recombinase)